MDLANVRLPKLNKTKKENKIFRRADQMVSKHVDIMALLILSTNVRKDLKSSVDFQWIDGSCPRHGSGSDVRRPIFYLPACRICCTSNSLSLTAPAATFLLCFASSFLAWTVRLRLFLASCQAGIARALLYWYCQRTCGGLSKRLASVLNPSRKTCLLI